MAQTQTLTEPSTEPSTEPAGVAQGFPRQWKNPSTGQWETEPAWVSAGLESDPYAEGGIWDPYQPIARDRFDPDASYMNTKRTGVGEFSLQPQKLRDRDFGLGVGNIYDPDSQLVLEGAEDMSPSQLEWWGKPNPFANDPDPYFRNSSPSDWVGAEGWGPEAYGGGEEMQDYIQEALDTYQEHWNPTVMDYEMQGSFLDSPRSQADLDAYFPVGSFWPKGFSESEQRVDKGEDRHTLKYGAMDDEERERRKLFEGSWRGANELTFDPHLTAQYDWETGKSSSDGPNALQAKDTMKRSGGDIGAFSHGQWKNPSTGQWENTRIPLTDDLNWLGKHKGGDVQAVGGWAPTEAYLYDEIGRKAAAAGRRWPSRKDAGGFRDRPQRSSYEIDPYHGGGVVRPKSRETRRREELEDRQR